MVKLRVAAAACAAALLPVVVSARRAASSSTPDTVLSSEPTPLTKVRTALHLDEVPCNTVQVLGNMPTGSLVKLTGAGWLSGALHFEVGRPFKQRNGDKGHTRVASIICHGPDAEDKSVADRCYQSKVSADGAAEEEEVSLPISGPGGAVMFSCAASGEAGLRCDVYGYDNAANDGWKVKTVDIPIRGHPDSLSFRLDANGLYSRKAYVSPNLNVDMDDPGLGCPAPPSAETVLTERLLAEPSFDL